MHKFYDLINKNYTLILLILTITILITISCICIFLFLLIIILIVGYILFKINDFNNTGNFINMYDYDINTKQCLSKYSDYKIKGLYLVSQPFLSLGYTITNSITLFKYDKLLKQLHPFHTQIILVIKKGKNTAFLAIHKRPNILINDTIDINKSYGIKKIPIRSKQLSVDEILTSVKDNMGPKYFNWNIVDNNCQNFSKEIIRVLNKYDKKYVKQDLMTKILNNKIYTVYDYYILNVLSSFLIIISSGYIGSIIDKTLGWLIV